jgi:hypothetical protein
MSNRRQRQAQLANAVFDMATCHGEEPQCWFSLAWFAFTLGVHRHDVEDALCELAVAGRLNHKFDADGDTVHVRQPKKAERA